MLSHCSWKICYNGIEVTSGGGITEESKDEQQTEVGSIDGNIASFGKFGIKNP